ILTPGESFEFILEREKLENIRKVISHNEGEVLSETFVDNDVRIKVRKLGEGDYRLTFSS
ncbi:MAG: hypothetical protein JRJ50_07450, partial [Deltaproteobacteria bacterium]|nr:hypothetical protein [Deltaproteobacteria bacterium]